MKARLSEVLAAAGVDRRAVAACNVYTLDQAHGILDAATLRGRALILQVHPSGAGATMWPLIAGLRRMADDAAIPVVVHLDHCADRAVIRRGLDAGIDSIMVDGSALSFADNVAFVSEAAALLSASGIEVEAELGRLSGAEDGLTVEQRYARMTDPAEAGLFVAQSGAAALAVCIGNIHGGTAVEPHLELERLEAIREACPLPLVLHGASGLSAESLRQAIKRGITKVNVNTELRTAYLRGLRASDREDELVAVIASARAMVGEAASQVIDSLSLDREEEG